MQVLIEKCLLFLLIFNFAETATKWKPEMKSFTHSVKQGGCTAKQEISLFEYTTGPGVITEQWFTGKGCIDETTIVQYYIDGDKTASIKVNLYLAHGIGFPGKGAERRYHETESKGMHRERNKIKPGLMSLKKKDQLEENMIKNKTLNDRHSRSIEDNLDETMLLTKEFNRLKTKLSKSKEENGKRRAEIHQETENADGPNINPLRNLLQENNAWYRGQNHAPKEEGASDDNLVPNDDIDIQAESRTEPPGIDSDPGIPWGTRRMGHLAQNGALYNTIRIPFQKSIYVSMISTKHGHYWYNVRGARNYPVIIGDLELPQNARLRVYKKENITVLPFQYIFLASSFNSSGLLYLVTFSTESKNFFHQEACFRAIIDNDDDIHYLSSGTEDLFLSAYYYNGGIYHTENSGLSYKDDPGRVTAYKFFEYDPIFFNEAFSLVWRCGEQTDNKCFKIYQNSCSRKYGNKNCVTEDDYEAVHDFNESNQKHIKPATISSYTWTYEW